MSLLTIDTQKCIKCSICIQSCPVSIIGMDETSGFPQVSTVKESTCILCGHCEAVCPELALTHNTTPKGATLISPDNTFTSTNLGNYFRARRSIRTYKQKPIEKELLEQVMDVVRYAPTGTNQQKNQWVVVLNKEIVKQLAEGTINWMREVSKVNPEMAKRVNFARLIAAYERGYDIICRNAPGLIICYTKSDNNIGAKDTIIATSHLELLLPSFGLGSCWAGYLMVALQYSPELKKVIGLDDTHAVHSALMVGYPKYRYAKIPQRKVADVSWM